MVFSTTIQAAIKFAIKTHELLQKQKRKGKDVPYVVHPLIVGLLLSRAGASDAVIAAGILHDTIEDSTPKKPVTVALITEKFGSHIAALVASVTEDSAIADWERRKEESLRRIDTYTSESLWIKSADVLANVSELLDDYGKQGEATFARFAAGKARVVHHYCACITALEQRSKECGLNPFLHELHQHRNALEALRG